MRYNLFFGMVILILLSNLASASLSPISSLNYRDLFAYYTFDTNDSANLLEEVFGNFNGTNYISENVIGNNSLTNGIINKSYGFGLDSTHNSVKVNFTTNFLSNKTSILNNQFMFNSGVLPLTTQDFTMQVWINATVLPVSNANPLKTIMADYDGGGWELELLNQSAVTSNQTIQFGSGNSPILINYVVNVSLGLWNQIIIMHNNTGYYLFYNGNESAKQITTSSMSNYNAADLFIGGFKGDTTRYFNGSIDEVAFWNRSLSATEISTLYNNGLGTSLKTLQTTIQYNNKAVEGFSETFSVKINTNNTFYPTISASLIYNNTYYTSTKVADDGTSQTFNTTISIPPVNADINISFLTQLILNNGSTNLYYNTSLNNQTVLNLVADDCTANVIKVFNFSLNDESSLSLFNGSANNGSIQADLNFTNSNGLQIFNISTNRTQTNSLSICLNQNISNVSYSLYGDVQYSGNPYVTEFYNFQNSTINSSLLSQNISLYDLLTTSAQSFLITARDENLLPIVNGLIEIQRKYISNGIFRIVEIPITDTSGQTIAHLNLQDTIYNFIVKKNGQIISSFFNQKAFCNNQATGDCKIQLDITNSPSGINNFNSYNNLIMSINFTKSTNLVFVPFQTIDTSTVTMFLNVTGFNNYGNYSLCSNSLTISSGTLQCTIPSSFGNGTAIASVYKDGTFVGSRNIPIRQSSGTTFGGTRVVALLFLFITLVMIGIGNLQGTIIGMILALVILSFLNVYDTTLLGRGSALLWILIASAIILWKVSRREKA